MQSLVLILSIIAVCAALPSNPILRKLDNEPLDQSKPLEDFSNLPRFNPVETNVYHLFTRDNPTTSQPIVTNADLLAQTNYRSSRRTIILIHGIMDSATSDFNSVLVPAFLAAEDLNVIVLDWSDGANWIIHEIVNANCVTSALAVAQFITWLNQASGSTLAQYHIVGHGVGGHQAGIVGRNLDHQVAYITGLNPSQEGWIGNELRFQADDGLYTEVIHTSGVLGYLPDIAQVDFYPNGGSLMPGCVNSECSHIRSFHYFAESIRSGGFTGIDCPNYHSAVLELCEGDKTLQMGGLIPKTGETGIYSLATNAAPPFSRG